MKLHCWRLIGSLVWELGHTLFTACNFFIKVTQYTFYFPCPLIVWRWWKGWELWNEFFILLRNPVPTFSPKSHNRHSTFHVYCVMLMNKLGAVKWVLHTSKWIFFGRNAERGARTHATTFLTCQPHFWPIKTCRAKERRPKCCRIGFLEVEEEMCIGDVLASINFL